MDALYQFGISLIQVLQNTFSPALDGFMQGASFLGRIEFYLAFISFLYLSVDRRIGIRALLLLIYADLTTNIFKMLFHQPRPYWLGDVKVLSLEPTYGFPSAHASNSLVIFSYLGTRIKKRWAWNILIVVILLVGISRLHLGVHFPHDVLAGWLIGTGVLWAFLKWEGRVRAWLLDKSLGYQIGMGFIDSALIILVGILIRFLLTGISDPASWSSFASEARYISHFYTLAGTAFGAYTGYALTNKYAKFDAKSGGWGLRILRYLIGVVALLGIYFGLDNFFATLAPDETTLGYVLRYVRYFFISFWAIFLAPWLFLKVRLTQPEH